MLVTQGLERFPVRARSVVVDYARVELVDWEMPIDVRDPMLVKRENQCGLMTLVGMTSDRREGVPLFSRLPLGLSLVRRWSILADECGLTSGITNYIGSWKSKSGRDHLEEWIEVRCELNTYTLKVMNFTETHQRSIGTPARVQGIDEDTIYQPGRRINFEADLSSNIFSVSFERYRVWAVIPHLHLFRPFVYFFARSIDTTVRFLDPSE